MAKYMQTAAEANEVAKRLMEAVKGPLGEKADEATTSYGQVAEMIARLVNYGVRCSPRGVQSTVRLNAVRRAVQDLPVEVSMQQKKDERTGRTYNVLVTKPTGGEATAEVGSADEE